MKPDDYNPKAREAFGKSLIDIAVAIFKSIMLLITAVPVTAIVKGALEGKGHAVSIWSFLTNMSGDTFATFLLLFFVAFIMAHWFRKEGLRHIHESEA